MAGQDNNKPDKNNTTPNNIGNDPEITSEENEDFIAEEYVNLDCRLDELNSALDFLEKKNDDITEKLKELLEDNRNIREQLRNGSDVQGGS